MIDITIENKDLTIDGKLKLQYPDIDGYFSCSGTLITSLVGAPLRVKDSCFCYSTKITSLQGIGTDYLQEIGGILYLNNCFKLKSHMLGIMLVEELISIAFDVNANVQDIFNSHLKGDRNLLDCKEELRNAGFKEYAKL